MPRFLTALTKTRLRVVVVISICFAVLTLASVVFPTRSRARVNPQDTTAGKRTRARFVPGEVLVRYKTESQARSRQGAGRVTTREGLDIPVQVERFAASNLIDGLRLARVPADQTLKAVTALKRQPDVLYAEPNYLYKAARLPNDPLFNDLGMSKINAMTAWDTQTGSRSIVVAVLDQGIDFSHEDLAANMWTNPAPGSIPGFSNDLHGYNFLDNNGNVFSGNPDEDHATHVAGTIGAVGDNGKGVVGVNWAVSLMSLKFLDTNTFGDSKDALTACTYAKAMRDLWQSSGGAQGANVRVINASFGGGPYSHLFEDAVSSLNDSGILFVAAAGNFNPATTRTDSLIPNNDLVPDYPANFNSPNVISVAATDGSDQLTSFSHFGALTVDLGAPGQDIMSTTPGNTYQEFSGTSMAAPHVSGSAALLWAQNPNLTVQQVKNLLMLNGDFSSGLINHTLSGRRLNVGNSFQALLEGDTTAPGTVTGFTISSQSGRTLNLSWTASGDDGGTGLAKLYLLEYTDSSSGAVIPLKGIIPPSAGTPQTAIINIPFGHPNGTLRLREFDNAGNEGTPASLSINLPLDVGDPYVPSVGSQAASLSTGGDRQNINKDDAYRDFLFPTGFSFPFFGVTYDSVTISSNGALYFSDPPLRFGSGDADDVPSSPVALSPHQMIAGLWDDIDLRNSERTDSGVYVVAPDTNRLIFRWQGVPCAVDFDLPVPACTGGAPVNFEIELRTDGTIKTRYGSGNLALNPTVGISGGDRDGYVIRDCKQPGTPSPCYTSESEDLKINLTNVPEVTFTPRAGGATPTPTPTPTPSPSPSPSPSPTPTSSPIQLILEEGGPTATQAAALDAMLFLRDMFPVINSSNLLNKGFDPNTRVVVFVTNLFPNEPASDVVIQLSDGKGGSHNFAAEDVRAMPVGFHQVIFKLPGNLTVDTWTIRVTAHGQVSNPGTIRIRAP